MTSGLNFYPKQVLSYKVFSREKPQEKSHAVRMMADHVSSQMVKTSNHKSADRTELITLQNVKLAIQKGKKRYTMEKLPGIYMQEAMSTIMH